MPAPILPDLRETVHRFTLGTAQVSTVLDGAVRRDAVRPPFAMDKSDAELAAIGRAANLPHDRMEHGFVPVVVNTGTELVLFDTGFGQAGLANGTGRLVEGLGRLGYAPGDIDVVAFTHAHPDHIQGVSTDGRPTFANARYVIGRAEFDCWSSGRQIPPRRAANRELFQALIVPLADRFTFVEDGQPVGAGITAEAAFGHSPGHMMYRVESAGRQLLVWGDVTNHYVYSLRHPDSPVAFDDLPDVAIATRRRVLAMAADDGLMVAGFHMPFPSVGHVERRGEGFAWVPATYQLRV